MWRRYRVGPVALPLPICLATEEGKQSGPAGLLRRRLLLLQLLLLLLLLLLILANSAAANPAAAVIAPPLLPRAFSIRRSPSLAASSRSNISAFALTL
jgi:hypothetical protein